MTEVTPEAAREQGDAEHSPAGGFRVSEVVIRREVSRPSASNDGHSVSRNKQNKQNYQNN